MRFMLILAVSLLSISAYSFDLSNHENLGISIKPIEMKSPPMNKLFSKINYKNTVQWQYKTKIKVYLMITLFLDNGDIEKELLSYDYDLPRIFINSDTSKQKFDSSKEIVVDIDEIKDDIEQIYGDTKPILEYSLSLERLYFEFYRNGFYQDGKSFSLDMAAHWQQQGETQRNTVNYISSEKGNEFLKYQVKFKTIDTCKID